MVRRKAQHATDAPFAFGDYQIAFGDLTVRRIRLQGGKVIVEYKRVFVVRIFISAGAFVCGAQIALRVVSRRDVLIRFFLLALPGPFCSVRRDDEPLAC